MFHEIHNQITLKNYMHSIYNGIMFIFQKDESSD